MRAISLFSGIGGLDLGLEKAGIETVLQVEQDKHALAVLERHWPQAERLTDVRDVGACDTGTRGGGEHRKPARAGVLAPNASGGIESAVDLIHGGFPCQDISVAGKRAGLSGERSGLWFEFARILEELRPRWCLIENVAGLLSSGDPPGADLGLILDTLVELGYGVAWRTVDAQHFGVPQRRRRVFIVGGPGDGTAASAVLAVGEGGEGHPAPGGAAGARVAVGVASGVAHAVSAVGGGYDYGANKGTLIPDIANAIGARDYKGAANVGWDGRIQGLEMTPQGVRRLTPLECERLMGFPDGWTDGQADTYRYRQLGNAVVVPVAEWIGHRLVRVEELLTL